MGAFIRSDSGHWWYASPLHWLAFYVLGEQVGERAVPDKTIGRLFMIAATAAVCALLGSIGLVLLRWPLASPLTGVVNALAYGTAGIALALGVLHERGTWTGTNTVWWTRLSLGVYVVHPFFLYTVVPMIVPGWRAMGLPGAVVGWTIGAALSLMTVLVIRRSRTLRAFL